MTLHYKRQDAQKQSMKVWDYEQALSYAIMN